MSVRLEALSRALFEVFPPGLEPFYVAVTSLGDTAFLVALLSVAYWAGGRRRETIRAVSIAFVGLATVVALKGFFAWGRPPVALVEAHGYGFPSGHALGATVVYGSLVLAYGRQSDRRTVAAVTVLVGAVALSRVALRVHYLGDVLVGLALGLAILVLACWFATDDPRPWFAAGGLLGIPAVGLTNASPDAVAVIGGCLAGLAVTTYLAAREPVPQLRSRGEAVALIAVGLPLVGVAKVGPGLLPPFPGVAGLDEFLVVVVVFALPFVFERTDVAGRFARAGEDG